MRRLLMCLMAGVVLVASGCGKTASQFRTKPLARYVSVRSGAEERTLQPGDRIVIHLHTTAHERLERVIDDDGRVTLPLLGVVRIGGLAPGNGEAAIKSAYIKKQIFKEGSIEVEIVPPPSEFFVTGQVRKPGTFRFTRNITVLQAIAMSGGRNEYAHKHTVKVRRGDRTIIIDAEAMRMGKEPDRLVEPGDTIDIPPSWW